MKYSIIELINKAISARENAYAPYSGFKVGAALVDNRGELFTGVNVENGSFGLTCCAERSAINTAVGAGMKRIKTIAIAGDVSGTISPCGACRQVISEFADEDTKIILSNLKGEYEVFTVDELLPKRFKL